MQITLKKVIKYAAATILMAVLLYFAFREIDWAEFMAALKRCNWWWIAASMLVGMAVAYSRGCRWRLMLLPINDKITRLECFDAYNVCYLANLAVPRSGEFVRCAMLSKLGRTTFQEAVGSMALERVWDIISALLIAVGMVLFTRFGTFLKDEMWKPFAEGLSFNAAYLVAGVVLLTALFIWFVSHFRNRYKICGKVHGFFAGLGDGVKAGFKMEHKLPFFLHTAFIWTMYIFQILFIIYAFPDVKQLNFGDAFFIMMIGSLGWMVPVQGGFGAYHFLVSAALVPVYGIAQQTGLVFATISHESQILQMLINGVISLISFWIMTRRGRSAEPLSCRRSC